MADRQSYTNPTAPASVSDAVGVPVRYEYETDPEAIYRASFATVRETPALAAVPAPIDAVAVRLIHACGMPDILDDMAFTPDVAASATAALRSGAPILCDCEMVGAGITRRFLPAENDVVVTLNDARTPALAKQLRTTRSAAAVELWEEQLEGAIVAIGNAPTCLFRLLEMIAAGGPRPAAVLGFAVGFIGAAESKAALADFTAQTGMTLPFITVHGTRGGSAMASAAVNAIAILARDVN